VTFLIDVNVIRELMRSNPSVVEKAEDALAAGHEVSCSATTRGELRFGIERLPVGKRRLALERAMELVLTSFSQVLPVDPHVADAYGRIKADLERRGAPIPDNDIWLAAVALANECTVVSNDRHFEAIPHLDRVNWISADS
jgi:tRNA(fMet)-specific endonuclease VapC